jgi:psiF repeat
MKTLYALALATLIGLSASVASAEDGAVAPTRSPKSVPAATKTAAGAPTKISQQDKMRLCAKQATGKKGAERKTYMKGCLSKKG